MVRNQRIAVGVVVGLAIACSHAPLLAQETEINPYGSVTELWIEGSTLADQGNFEEAQYYYKQALDAANDLEDLHLRACAIAGSEAGRQSMQVALDYINAYGSTPETVRTAQDLAEVTFHSTWESLGSDHPGLLDSCP